ncbi:hypothetical protein ACRE_055270 [Hapsidospora chrysogenum ATCC 11550]|uniref:Uncharacterized protein n=1 Tax=Hapsidospora chrysogenum (strain ATCC 11550 / CBS 779.69 / DSM 880 / IAM 14645 / JCM 23072 / IMI 49137) TaxID=857340 RepID=A0A086T300_HAPC1|nr:hypothetical protein ACRE_055270 [Hapsidospora chrysogenum ATCC 11550]
MAAPKPVPSRAVLNALRGLVFTTSCSVILLAEERRRRTKVARAAIDNARKLHTVKARRRPLAMLDSRLPDSDLELLSIPQATDGPRPRKRRPVPDHDATSSGAKSRVQADAPTTKNNEHADRSASLAASGTNSASKSGFSVSPAVGLSAEPSSSPRSHLVPGLPEAVASVLERPLSEATLDRRFHTELLKPQGREEMQAEITTATSRVLDAVNSGHIRHIDPLSAKVLHYLRSPPRLDRQGAPRLDNALPCLKRLVEELETHPAGGAMCSVYRELGLGVFKKVISQKPPMTLSKTVRQLRYYCLRLVKIVIQHTPEELGSTLDVVLPLYKDVDQLSVPLLRWLAGTDNREGLRNLLRCLSSQPSSTYALNGSSVLRLLNGYAKRYKSACDTRRAYDALQNAGLPELVDITPAVEYDVHRYFLQLAHGQGDISMCLEEIGKLCEIDPDRAKEDRKLRGAVLITEASTGQALSVEASLQRLEDMIGPDSEEFLPTLSSLAGVWAQLLPPQEFEAAVRKLVETYRLPLERRWLYPVLGYHSKCADPAGMLSWLQFCVRNGYHPDDELLQNFYHSCRTYWRISDEEVYHFYETLREANPDLPPPRAIPQADATKRTQASKPNPKQTREDWETMYIRSAESLRPEDPCFDAQIFKTMQSCAFSGDWESVWASYEKNGSSALVRSLRCMRLAVLARLKLDAGSTAGASRLIEESAERGLDASELLTPVLMAHLAAGQDAGDVVRGTLRRGLRIHDMVYNKAAQSASRTGRQLEAIEICNLAAKENGQGDPLYSPYNFYNLVFAYTDLASYDRLAPLLSGFTAGKRWWAGKWLSKQAIKLAMKKVAKRAVTADTGHVVRKHEAALSQLNDALEHAFRCNQSPEQKAAMMHALAETFLTSMSNISKSPAADSTKATADGPRTTAASPASTTPKTQGESRKSAPVRYMTVKSERAPKEATRTTGGKTKVPPRPKDEVAEAAI